MNGLERRRARGRVAGCDPGDSDSEGDNERWFFEQEPPPGRESEAMVNMRRGHEEPGNSKGVLRVRSSSGSPPVFPNEQDRCADVGFAVVDGAHVWGRRRVQKRRRVLMRASSGRGVVTPDLAQQAGVLPYRQRQHDREEN